MYSLAVPYSPAATCRSTQSLSGGGRGTFMVRRLGMGRLYHVWLFVPQGSLAPVRRCLAVVAVGGMHRTEARCYPESWRSMEWIRKGWSGESRRRRNLATVQVLPVVRAWVRRAWVGDSSAPWG